MSSSFPTPIPQASTSFVDVSSGRLTLTGYRFLSDIWNRTGGAAGSTPGNYLRASNNLSDLVDKAASRNNLGLGSAAVQNASAFATAAQGKLAATALQPNGPGLTVSIVASEALAANAVVNVWSNGGVANVRNADGSTTGKEVHGFVTSAFIAGQTATVCLSGMMTGLSGLAPGPVYLSTTAGQLTTTAPTAAGQTVQQVGICVDGGTEVLFAPKAAIWLS